MDVATVAQRFNDLAERFNGASELPNSGAIVQAVYPITRQAGQALWEALDASLLPVRPGLVESSRERLEERANRGEIPHHMRWPRNLPLDRFLEPECQLCHLYADWLLAHEPGRPQDGLSQYNSMNKTEEQVRLLEVERAQTVALVCRKIATLLCPFPGRAADPELEALGRLAVRRWWGVDELPPGIDADMLRCLDDREFAEARYVLIVNSNPAGSGPWVPNPSEWFSPIQCPTKAGDWTAVYSDQVRSARKHPDEVHVSEKGKVELARERRAPSAGIATDAYGNIFLTAGAGGYAKGGDFNITAGAGGTAPGGNISITAGPGQPTGKSAQPDGPQCTHGDDFTWVMWYGKRYTFTKGVQAQCVKALWENWERAGRCDGCGLAEETLGAKSGSSSEDFRLAPAFRDHPAWGTMIRAASRGVYALYAPSNLEKA